MEHKGYEGGALAHLLTLEGDLSETSAQTGPHG